MAHAISLNEERLASAGVRKELGAYYTPEFLVDRLLDLAFDGIDFTPGMVIGDPACGDGAFLVAMARRLLAHADPKKISKWLRGYDIDPVALKITRQRLEALGVRPKLVLGDYLGVEQDPANLWIGNPPFRNAIERKSPSKTRHLFPELGGTCDTSYEFFARASRSLKSGGRIAFVMPRPFLTAPSAKSLRQSLEPKAIVTFDKSDFFAGASVFISLVVAGEPDGHPCMREHLGSETRATSHSKPGSNWWTLVDRPTEGPCLGSYFEVLSSLSAGEAYDLLDYVEEDGLGPRFMTSGLIDPGLSLWGNRPCRFLGATYARPTISVRSNLSRRIQRAHRPKVLVAGLSRRIEAFHDREGKYFGAVSTYGIYDHEDSFTRLDALANYLNSDEVSEVLQDELGATALGGGSITVTKEFLKALQLPVHLFPGSALAR